MTMRVEEAARAITRAAYLRLTQGDASEAEIAAVVDDVWQLNEDLAREVVNRFHPRPAPPRWFAWGPLLLGTGLGFCLGVGAATLLAAGGWLPW